MKTNLKWIETDESTNISANIETPPKQPMSDARFNQLVRVATIGIIAGANVGCAYLLGFPGLLFSGMIDIVIVAISMVA